LPASGPTHLIIPDGDNRERKVCRDCGFIAYENPKIVVGSVCLWEDRFLLCERAIEPRAGYWTLPAGYLELHDATAAGARARSVGRSASAHRHRRLARDL
jgi:8-oxo-dGTP pyrophosphatase MutT (NUDIX family)